jgi:hypothetical protein
VTLCPPEVEGSTIIKQPKDLLELIGSNLGTSNWLAIPALADETLARPAARKASGG